MYYERMNTVLLYIQSHLDDELHLDTLAALSFFSPIHFHRIFKGMMGETVTEHIRRIRLERAAQRLACGTSSVTHAAFDAGYETVESFSRAFKKMLGCSPSAYPEKHFSKLYEKLPGSVHYRPDVVDIGLEHTVQEETSMDVKIMEIEQIRIAFVRHTGPYIECGPAWQTLCDWAGPKGLLGADTKFIGISHDDPTVTPPEKLRFDACINVGDEIEAQGEVGIQSIPGGKYLLTTHKGPYEKLENTYAELMGKWLPQSGEELGESGFEIFLNSVDTTPPEELLTEIYIAVK